MKKVVLGNGDYILDIEPSLVEDGGIAGHPMLTFRKVGQIGAQVGDIVTLPRSQIDELTDHDESFGIVFASDAAAVAVAGFISTIIHGSVNTASEH